QVNCAIASTTLDFDNDGFTDAQECAGITLFDKTPFPGVVSGQPRAGRLDPNTKDVFVILVRATPTSLIPTTVPYQFISASQSAGGLGLFVHEISKTQAAADRTVTGVLGSQKAARLTESLDTNG